MATKIYDSEPRIRKLAPVPPEEEIVISGISGRFPDSNNMKHFEENLMNKVDLVTDDDRRWKLDHPEIPQNTGKINNVSKFDALFFGVHFKQAHTMDPMCRMLLEHAYEAIVDAGINPKQLRGSRTGVFIGACFSESEKTWFYEKLQVNGFGITGCSRAMLANRISYWLGVTGPSYAVDTACSSSLFALEHAYRSIRDGLCDAAIVGGANLCLHPYVSLQFSRLGVLSPDGRCKSFDESANGYARSEAVACVFLQKAKDSKRVYATVVHAKTNCDGFKEQGITFPSSIMQGALLKEFYEELGVPPTSLSFVEAHGTGTKVGDPEEVNALDRVFCTGRKDPLWIGSIKSNLGHSEPASGLCSVAKIVIGMESGLIPPNLHYKNTRKGIEALEKGRLRVVTEPTPWKGGLVGINSFGFGGANAHILLRSNQKEKINGGQPQDDLPRLVAVSGRTELAVQTILDDLEKRPTDVEYVRLLHDIHTEDINGHLYRGYTILPPRGLVKQSPREIENYLGVKRPVWFVFSGMGSQWPAMGESLMRLPVFVEAIKKCDAALKPHKINIVDIITNKDKKTFDNILNSFVGIAAIQIGLVDVLRSVGIEADNYIGHSVGELGCAYADGCFTAEQMILAAYSRGLASIETKFVHGSMAAVGLGYAELKEMCPADIEIACHNSADSATISGPAESMKAFVAKLQANNVFAKEVPCSNIPYHSRYIAQAGPKLLAYLQKVIPSPKPRSSKWLSTSVPRSKWETPAARLSSAEYHTNNLLSPVLFEETSLLIPKDAVTIEIAPHGLLQAILKRSLAPTVTNIALTRRGHEDNVEVLLQGLGKLYNAGLQPQLHKLYPRVQYPVSRTTPMLSHLIKWEHSEDWFVTSYRLQEKITSGERLVSVTLADEDFEFMSGHVIDGRNLFPATGYLSLIWETLGMMRGELYTEVSVVFEDVKFLRATTIPKEGIIEFTLMIQKGTGRFEVVEGGAAVVTGFVRATDKPSAEKVDPKILQPNNDEEIMTSRDVYKELRLRGYHYSGMFRSLKSSTCDGTKGHILWHNNWVAFMDNMLQMQILGSDTRGLFVPTGLMKLVIDTKTHLNEIRTMDDENKEFSVIVNKTLNLISAGGVEIRGLKASAISRRKPAGEPVLEKYQFIAHRDRAETSLRDLARIATHIGLENHMGIKVRTLELVEESDKVPVEELLSPHLAEALGDMPLIQADVNLAGNNLEIEDGALPANVVVTEPKKIVGESNALLAVGHRLLERAENLNLLLEGLKEGGFLLTREDAAAVDSKRAEEWAQASNLHLIAEKRSGSHVYVLLRKKEKMYKKTIVINVSNDKFDWVDEMKKIMTEEIEKETASQLRIVFVSEGNFESGLIGFINCLRKEAGGEIVRGLLIQDTKAPKFSLQNPFYTNELHKDLAMSVLGIDGQWGSYRHLPLPALEPKPVRHAWANQLVRGDLNSLCWLEGPIQTGFEHDDLVNIVYSSINFRDVMLSTGKLAVEVVAKTRQSQECVLGFEYTGVTSRGGRRIMGMIENRAMTNLCLLDPNLTWEVPANWSLEDAATVPCVYGTCYYALYLSGKMKKGDKVLIHAGSGGVGQAAITLALFQGCEVFTTVGTPDKRRFIREHFPQIPESHIGNSRDTSFEQLIMRETEGRGVDIVLNSLAEEKLQASVRCLAQGGHFLEIGKFDLAANNPLGMECFLKEISFHGIMLDNLFNAPDEQKRHLRDIMAVGLKNGAIKPLTRTVFPKDQMEAAFRYMAAGKHIGKVIIKVREEDEAPNTPMLALPRYHCLEDRSYLILGGLGGFGLELADWLVLRGAKHLVITSRTGIRNGYQKMRVDLWKSYGTNVVIVSGKDASKRDDCKAIIEIAANLAPVDAIFNLAVVLKDAIWDNQTPETFEESFRAKAWSTKHLDHLTRSLCPKLRQFVVFSSVSCGRGNAGQTNYGMSNSVMERICERRAAEGLPGLAVQWGAIGDVGLVADMQEDNKELVIGGTLQQRISSCLQELDGFLRQQAPIVSSMVVAEKRAGGAGTLNVVDTVLNIMGLKDLKTVSPQTSLAELGMDSMMAVEIKQTLEREFELFLTAQDIRSLNFAKLQEMAAKNAEASKKRGGADADKNAEVITGMKLLVRVVGTADFNPEVCLPLATKQEGKAEIFMIPGIEGIGKVFDNLALKIKAPAYCLQLGTSDLNSDINAMADKLTPYILERSADRRDFLVVGYSFGSMIAIEIVRRLEATGMTGKLIIVDGSPELMKRVQNQQLASNSDEELQSNVLLGMMDILSPADSAALVTELEKHDKWETKLAAFLQRWVNVPGITMSQENQAAFCTSVYRRLQAVQAYDASAAGKIKTPIMLLKPTQPTLRAVPEDYLLGEVTSDKVEIHYVEGNHVTILDHNKVAKAINGEPLEDAEEFKQLIFQGEIDKVASLVN
ncbi:fatty acid synthase-like [Trichogramma pretiosum]|uniref:fatty acid synthase-like n=1 Tax=Trichogramma pretiosum TaxID=7493 RepID=UPI000C719151|nr:fatty acid synthase-like [Trichogramma pretiosum]